MKMEEKLRLIDQLGAEGLSEEEREWYRKAKDTMVTRNYKRMEKGLTDEIRAESGLSKEKIKAGRERLLEQAKKHGMEKLEHYLKLKLKEV